MLKRVTALFFVWIQISKLSNAFVQRKTCIYLQIVPLQLSSKANEDGQSAFDKFFNNLDFNYEKIPADKTKIDTKKTAKKTSLTKSQGALCYPKEERLRGCQPLFSDNLTADSLKGSNFQSLPCVVDGSCPYSQFKCNKGHVWKAVHGSPVCFHCPVCDTSRKVYGQKEEATAERLLKLLKVRAVSNGGMLLSTTLDDNNKWSSMVSMRCSEGHEWTGKVGNILLNKSGCFQCAILKKRYGAEEMHETAEYFGGQFLGFADNDSTNIESNEVTDMSVETNMISLRVRRALWQCAEGHTFSEIAGNIRRPPGGKRKCSWCKICRRNGREFEWNPIGKVKEITKESEVSL